MLPDATAFGQSWLVTPELTVGRPLPVQKFLRGDNLAGHRLQRFMGGGITLYHHRAQPQDWELRYGLPRTGLGVRRFYLDNPEELGHATVAYRSFSGPFRRFDRGSLEYVSAVGLAHGFRRYDYYTNPLNLLISTSFSAYVQLGIGARHRLSDRFDLLGNVSLHHFSNGNFKRPNLGLNAVAATVSLRYRTRKTAETWPTPPPSEFVRRSVVNLVSFVASERRIYYSPGLPFESFYRGLRHPVAAISLSVERRLTCKSSLGLGTTLIYRATDPIDVRTENGRVVLVHPGLDARQLRVGIFPVYVQHFGRVDVIVQPEFYVYQRGHPTFLDRMSQRLGFRYRLTPRLHAGIAVNARNFSVADFVEWRVGYEWTVPKN